MISIPGIANEVYLRIDQGEDASIPKLHRTGVNEIVKAVFDIISQAVISGEEVSIHQFGKFEPVIRPARNGRNPLTGEKLSIPEKMSVKFRISAGFRKKLSDGDIKAVKQTIEAKVKEAKSKRGAKKAPAAKPKKKK